MGRSFIGFLSMVHFLMLVVVLVCASTLSVMFFGSLATSYIKKEAGDCGIVYPSENELISGDWFCGESKTK